MRVRILTLGLLALSFSVVAGCSPDNPLGRQGVSGTVTYNGQPVPSGSLSLMPQTNATTLSGAQIVAGKFTIPPENGVVPGEYGVAISIPDPDWVPSEQAKFAKEVAPPEWSSGKHKITVPEGGAYGLTFDVVNDKPTVYGKSANVNPYTQRKSQKK